jgi:hypothetical protein
LKIKGNKLLQERNVNVNVIKNWSFEKEKFQLIQFLGCYSHLYRCLKAYVATLHSQNCRSQWHSCTTETEGHLQYGNRWTRPTEADQRTVQYVIAHQTNNVRG